MLSKLSHCGPLRLVSLQPAIALGAGNHIFQSRTYFIEAMRMVILKGSGLAGIKNKISAVIGFVVFFNG